MRNYRAVPQWWYIAMLAVNFMAAGELEKECLELTSQYSWL